MRLKATNHGYPQYRLQVVNGHEIVSAEELSKECNRTGLSMGGLEARTPGVIVGRVVTHWCWRNYMCISSTRPACFRDERCLQCHWGALLDMALDEGISPSDSTEPVRIKVPSLRRLDDACQSELIILARQSHIHAHS